MLISDKKSMANPLRQMTLCFLLKDDRILLAMKKRGFGEGKWNGYGGKPMIAETIIDAAIRETQEEIGVTPKQLKKVATLNFIFPKLPKFQDWDQQVVVFFIEDWEGEPRENEEMSPQWFSVHELPFSRMWPDDIYWLPKVLQGNSIKGEFHFNRELQLEDFTIENVT
jgi:8-oxo-dGTP pyrophosphatase MutT (NUDIX family)